MINPETHKIVSDLAADRRVTQPDIVEAAVECAGSVDGIELFSYFLDKVVTRKEETRRLRQESRRKLNEATKNMSEEDLGKLLSQIDA